jgi:hypothetical protein
MINAKSVQASINDYLSKNEKISKYFGDIISFGLIMEDCAKSTPKEVAPKIIDAAKQRKESANRIINALASESNQEVKELPNSYERFKILYYSLCQKCYFDALSSSEKLTKLLNQTDNQESPSRVPGPA